MSEPENVRRFLASLQTLCRRDGVALLIQEGALAIVSETAIQPPYEGTGLFDVYALTEHGINGANLPLPRWHTRKMQPVFREPADDGEQDTEGQ